MSRYWLGHTDPSWKGNTSNFIRTTKPSSGFMVRLIPLADCPLDNRPVVSVAPGRWRLRLSAFDFSFEYKKGARNTVADAVSRVETTDETQGSLDKEIPCFCVESEYDRLTVDPWWGSDPRCNIDEDIVDDENLFDERIVIRREVLAVERTDPLSLVFYEELVRPQSEDAFCRRTRAGLDRGE